MSQNNIDLADLSLLTPGSVYHKKDGKKRFVLFITETTISGSLADDAEKVVVFANEDNKVFTLTVERFLARCKFHHVEPVLESRLESLFSFIEPEDDDNSLDFTLDGASESNVEVDEVINDSTQIEEDVAESVEREVVTALNQEQGPYLLTFSNSAGIVQGLPLAAELLSEMVTSYEQEPNIGQGAHFHKITFTLPANITADQVKQCFDTSGERSEVFYDLFTLSAAAFEEEARTVNWTHSVGAFRTFRNGAVHLQVVLAEDCEYVSAEDFDVSSELDQTPEVVSAQVPDSVPAVTQVLATFG